MKKVFVVVVVFVLFAAAIGVVSAQETPNCDKLLEKLEQIPPYSPGYANILEIAQANCGVALDHTALLALYYSTDGDNWINNQNWLVEEDHCTWYSVTCNIDGRVTSLNLWNNGLSGPIPIELGYLRNLQSLRLFLNELSGPIPPELGNLNHLWILELDNAQLIGPIPPELGNLSSLQYLNLGHNQLSGPIPPELGKLSHLEFLVLSTNQLSGSIPPELGDLNTFGLYLQSNQLRGPIPPEFGNLSYLHYLNLQSNNLSGPIPPELENLSSLEYLNLLDNRLTCWKTEALLEWALYPPPETYADTWEVCGNP